MENDPTQKPEQTGYEKASLEDIYQKMEIMNAQNSKNAVQMQIGNVPREDFDFFNDQVQSESRSIRLELERRGIIKPSK